MGMCEALDNVLSGEKYPLLQGVYLHKTIAFIYFPKLCKADMLRVLTYSPWLECVKAIL